MIRKKSIMAAALAAVLACQTFPAFGGAVPDGKTLAQDTEAAQGGAYDAWKGTVEGVKRRLDPGFHHPRRRRDSDEFRLVFQKGGRMPASGMESRQTCPMERTQR